MHSIVIKNVAQIIRFDTPMWLCFHEVHLEGIGVLVEDGA